MSSRTAAGRRRMQNMPQKRDLRIQPSDYNPANSNNTSFFQSNRRKTQGGLPSITNAPYPSPPADTVPLPLPTATSIISPSSPQPAHSPLAEGEENEEDEMGKTKASPNNTFYMVNAATFPVAYPAPAPASPKPAASISSVESRDRKMIYQHPNAGSNSSMNSGSTTRTRIRFRSKKSKGDKKDRAVESSSSADGVPGPSKDDRLTHGLPPRPLASPNAHLPLPSPPLASTSRLPPRIITSSAASSSSGSSGGGKARNKLDTPFIFPTSRSRAYPSKAPSSPVTSNRRNSNIISQDDPFGAMAKAYFGGLRRDTASARTQSSSSASGSGRVEQKERLKISGPIHLLPSPVAPRAEEVNEPKPPTPAPARVGRVGVYPLDPYDPMLLEGDRHTNMLLNHMMPSGTSPTFHQFGNTPPGSILDLGCGTGTWLLEAAEKWKGYGTLVTGVDMVDVTKDLRGRAKRLGVENNVSFVRVNFMKKKLPFPTESFDLVRLSCLTYCVSFDRWEWVLEEVKRVLNVGGRVEIIDDHVFFPYGKPPSPTPNTSSAASMLSKVPEDASVSSSTANRSSMIVSPEPPHPYFTSLESGKQLESLFENLVNTRFGIHLCPSEFLPGMLHKIFGWQVELGTWHWTLTTGGGDDGMDKVKGMTLWPDTFVPMSREQVEHAAFRQPRILLSMKTLLSSYAVELHREDKDIEEEEMDETDVMEALWEYDGFLQHRFFPPPTGASTVSSRNSMRHSRPASMRARRNSVMTMSSVSEEAKEAMWEYESDVRNHFGWAIQEEPTESESGHVQQQESERGHPGQEQKEKPEQVEEEEEPVHVRTFHVYEAIKMPSSSS